VKPVVAIAALFLFAPIKAFAHGDEDHGASAPAVGRSVAPRAVARSEEFEAVAVLEGKKLLLYLDRFASNAPVVGAKVEIEGGGLKGAAAETSPGVYGMDAAPITQGKHPLTISIEVGDSADLLSATLDVAPLPVGVAAAHGWGARLVGWGGGLLALAGGAWWAMRRQQSKGVKRCAN
jgi:hypothetical protein